MNLDEFAEHPEAWAQPERTLRGKAAADFGWQVLESAGVDVVGIERSVGRPRIGGTSSAPKGVRSPRVNVAISAHTDELLNQLEQRRGVSRSELVREALDHYLQAAG